MNSKVVILAAGAVVFTAVVIFGAVWFLRNDPYKELFAEAAELKIERENLIKKARSDYSFKEDPGRVEFLSTYEAYGTCYDKLIQNLKGIQNSEVDLNQWRIDIEKCGGMSISTNYEFHPLMTDFANLSERSVNLMLSIVAKVAKDQFE